MAKIVGGVTATPTPKVDAALDPNSANAVQNQAVTRRVLTMENGAYQLSERVTAVEKDLDTVDELANSVNALGATVAAVSTGMASLSTQVTGLTDDVETLSGSVEEQSKQIEDVSSAVWKKQDELVSGQNIKTINGKSVLGDGNIDTSIPVDGVLDANSQNPVQNKAVSAAVADINNNISTLGSNVSMISARVGTKQDTLVSGTNIKTVNGQSLLGGGDITIEAGTDITVDDDFSETSENPVQNRVITVALNQAADTLTQMAQTLAGHTQAISHKQNTLVSGENIKTVNGQSLLGEGDITVEGGGGGASITVDDAFNPESTNPVQNKVITAALGEAQGTLAALAKQTTPAVTSADNGKVLQVVDGVWTAVTVADSAIKTYVDEYISEALGGEY